MGRAGSSPGPRPRPQTGRRRAGSPTGRVADGPAVPEGDLTRHCGSLALLLARAHTHDPARLKKFTELAHQLRQQVGGWGDLLAMRATPEAHAEELETAFRELIAVVWDQLSFTNH